MTAIRVAVPRARLSDLSLFFVGSGAWFACIGIQTVIFPWLLTNVMNETPRWIGVAQMCVMLPVLFLVLPGGHIADRVALKRHLLVIQLLGAFPAFLLATVILSRELSYWQLIVYALSMGSLSAFANPAREAFLNILGGERLERAVTLNIGIEFGIQVVGFAIGGFAAMAGPQYVLYLQAGLMAFGAVAIGRISFEGSPGSARVNTGMAREILDAAKTAAACPVLSRVIFLNLMIGILFLGSFFVLVPLAVVRVFHGDVNDIAVTNIVFMSGTIAAVVGLITVGGLPRRGRALLVSCGAGALLLAALALEPTWTVFLVIMFAWGAASGITLSMGQTIIQEWVPQAHKARILSIFLLCFMGGNTLGSVSLGNILEYLPILWTALIPGTVMLACVILLAFQGPLWQLTTQARTTSSKPEGSYKHE